VKRVTVAAPWVFTLIWSSGFVVAKYAFADGDSLYFLALRLLLAAAILFLLTLILRQPTRLSASDFRSTLLIGMSLHGLYLGGVWYAIELGAPAGLSSVITSMQPILVSLIAVRLLSEPLTWKQIVGLLSGLAGVVLVVFPKLTGKDGFTAESLSLLFVALIGSTAATLMQKKIGHEIPLMMGTTYQFLAAGVVMLAISIARGRTRFELTHTSFWTMTWAVLVTSIAAILLLLWLLNHGTAAKVSSLLYLVPPMAVIQGYLLFNEKVAPLGIAGIGLTALGVALVIQS
jgi:drug/metabolite transporter (DMT)-like permease